MASSSKRDIVLETYPLSYNTHTRRTYLMFHSFLDLLKWCTTWLGDCKVLTLTVNRSSERLLSQFLLHETLDVKCVLCSHTECVVIIVTTPNRCAVLLFCNLVIRLRGRLHLAVTDRAKSPSLHADARCPVVRSLQFENLCHHLTE